MSADVINAFYEAFAKRDAATMGACYTDDVHFTDPVFPDLHGDEARKMWEMLCEQGTDLVIEHSAVQSDGKTGSAHWDAHYSFGKAKRQVHNRIDATFEFRDGKIARHVDTFDLWRWSRMALGPTGLLLGWTPFVRNKIRGQAAHGLRKFMDP